MAIVFKEKLKTQQFFLYLLFLLIIGVIFLIGWRLTTKRISPQETAIPQFGKRVKINFEVLKHPLLQILQPIEKIPPLETELNRENPFLPYPTSTPPKFQLKGTTPSQ